MPDIFDELGSDGGDIFDQVATGPSPKAAALAAEAAELRARPPAGFVRGAVENLKEVGGDVVRGVAQMPVGGLRLAGQTADFIRRHVPTGPEFDVGGDRSALTAAGDWLENQVNRLPGGDPEALSTQFNRGIGQMGTMLAGGGATRLLGGSGAAAASVGATMGFGAEFDDAFQRARRRGDDPDTSFAKALGYGSVATLIENIGGAGRVLRRLMPDPRQAAQTLTAWGVSRGIVGNFLAGYAEDASQRIAQNVIVAPEEGLLTGAHQEGRVGALVQGLVGLPGAAVRPPVRPAEPPAAGPAPGQTAVDEGQPAPMPAGPQAPATVPPGTQFLEFRDKEGRSIVVEVPPGADANRYKEATFLQHPGAELVQETVVPGAEPAPAAPPPAPAEPPPLTSEEQAAVRSELEAEQGDVFDQVAPPQPQAQQPSQPSQPSQPEPVAPAPAAPVDPLAGLDFSPESSQQRISWRSKLHPLLARAAGSEQERTLGRWHAIENTYTEAKAASEALPGVPFKDIYGIQVKSGPFPHSPVVDYFFVPRDKQREFFSALGERYRREGKNYTIYVSPGVEPYAPRKGEPSFKRWLAGERPAEPQAQQPSQPSQPEPVAPTPAEPVAPTPAEPAGSTPGLPADRIFSNELRDRVLAAVEPYLWDDQSDDRLLATIERAANVEFGKLVDERSETGKLEPVEVFYINQWKSDYFARAVLHHIHYKNLLKPRQAAPQPAPTAPAGDVFDQVAPGPKPKPQAPAEKPSVVEVGQWVEYEDSYGKTQRGKVENAYQVRKFVPGSGASAPRIEYLITDASGNYLPNPRDSSSVRRIDPPAIDQPTKQEQSTTEAQDERERTTDDGRPGEPGGVPGTGGEPGQPVAGPSAVDVREPAGADAQPAPGEPAGAVGGPEVPAGPRTPRAPRKPRAPKGPGVGRGDSGDTGAAPAAEPGPAEPAAGGGTTPDRAEPEPVAPPPELKPEDRNHVLPADRDWIPAGDKSKARANIEAIKLLRILENEDRNPTPEEKAVLAKYVGWGGLKEIFDVGKAAYRDRPSAYLTEEQRKESANWEKQWRALYDELRELLTEEEYATARTSMLNAHYTSRTVIRGMWEAVQRLGFRGGNALEPSAGIGHFIGLTPEALRDATQWSAVEIDQVSGRILAKLYPQAYVRIIGFEAVRLPVNSQDLVVTNVPFRKDGPSDDRYPPLSLHNYFFVRGLDLVKPGGLMVAITSDGTLDAPMSRKARELMAERADLVGAIRLPNTAFKANAGTEVTTDILIFRKRDGSPFEGQRFVEIAEGKTYKGEPVEINEYFVAHPEMMLGRMSTEGKMYREGQRALLPTEGADLAQQLTEAVNRLPADVFGAQATPEAAQARELMAGHGAKIGALIFRDGKPYQVNPDGTMTAPEWAGNAKAVKQAKAYVGLRDAARALILKQLDPEGRDDEIAGLRAALNREYDAYAGKYGPVNGRATSFLEDDTEFPMVLALEDDQTSLVETVVDKGPRKGQKVVRKVVTWVKSRIFQERTIFPRVAPTTAATIEDGYQVSMNFRGRVDVDYIAELTGAPAERVKARLVEVGLAFENPATGQMEPRWQYLSGNVKRKLREAENAAADETAYAPNVEALKAVQPPSIPIENITVRLGATWVPEAVIQRFIAERLEVNATVSYTPQTGNWSVDPTAGWAGSINTTTYGIHGFSGVDLVRLALNLKGPVVTYTEQRVSPTTGKPYDAEVKDPVKTAQAQEKQQHVKDLFVGWVRATPAVATELERLYNEQFNGVVAPQYQGPDWPHYPGASSDITLREHQKRIVTRMVQHSTLVAHAVGTGKTYSMVTAAMEMRRLGLARKPMIVVQNATLEQFARSFKRLYPTARILVPSAKQRQKVHRNTTMSRIATGDWDAVIVPQSYVNMLPDSSERERAYIQGEIAELEEALIEANRRDGKRSPKAADLQRAIERLKKRLSELADRKTDDVLTFEQLGVDALFVDEAHAYKKLQFSTKMESIKGLDTGASQRGFSMMMKARWVQERNQGRNVIFATGTPVSNTIAEAWNMMRYVRPDVLKEYNIERFDSFAATFGDTVTALEMTAGGTWKPVTRFARYTNGPELIAAWRRVADVVTAEEVNLPGLPALDTGKTIAVTVRQSPALAAYVVELKAELAAFDAMTGKDKRDNSHIPLVVFGKARKASLDMRMIDPRTPDEPGSKLNEAVARIYRIYTESMEVQGTQMVFADLYQDNPDAPRFNLYLELKRKLREKGIPENEIAIVTADIKDAKREALFDQVNEGKIRVVIGSTERMGIGVNAQRKLIALHHLDAPMRPMDVEQRNGRILRQGNENPVVQVFSYGVENTLDAAMFQKLATKQRFINQILRGDLQGRNFEDAANEISLSFEEQMAAFSGDPLALERVTLDNQVRSLEALRSGHIEQIRRAREDLDRLTSHQIPSLKKAFAEARERAVTFTRAFEGGDYTLELDGETVSGRKNVVAALDAWLKQELGRVREVAEEREKLIKAGQSPQRVVTGAKLNFILNGQRVAAQGDTYLNLSIVPGQEIKVVIETPVMRWKFDVGNTHNATTGQGLVQSVPGEVLNITKQIPDDLAAQLAQAERNQRELASFVLTQWDREAELAAAKKRLAEVTAILEDKGKEQKALEESAANLLEVPRMDKPLEAQRQHIRRLLDQMEQTAEESGVEYDKARFQKLVAKLRRIEREMLDRLQKLKMDLHTAMTAFGVVPAVWNAAIDVARVSIRGGASLAVAVAKAINYIRSRQKKKAWDVVAATQALQAISVAEASGASPTVQTQIAVIEGQAAGVNQAPTAPTMATAPALRSRLRDIMGTTSGKVAYYGGPALLRAKRGIDLTAAYQAAAVKRQADDLMRQLFAGAHAAQTGWKLPAWMRIGAWADRTRDFKRRVLHIAARLNATGRNPDGSFAFADFSVRSGMMTPRAFRAGKHQVGDRILHVDTSTALEEEFEIGPLITTDGRTGYQLFRRMDGATQAELYQAYASEYPELIWLLDMFIDPALAGMRQTINGVQVPVFNRFAQAAMMADSDPNFTPITGYTPDVLVTRSLLGAIRGALSFRAGTKSPGRRYKFGTSRESGNVRDLLSGFNVRTFQMLQEESRKQWRQAVLAAARPITGGVVPDGWVKVETGLDELWQAVKRMRRWTSPVDPATGLPIFPQTEARMGDAGSPEWRAFFGEAATLRGRQLMLPKPLVESLLQRYVAHVEHGALYRLGAWLVRNSTQLFLVMPLTYVTNVLTNDLFTVEAAVRYGLRGLMRADGTDLRFARELLAGMVLNRFAGLRMATGIGAQTPFMRAVANVLPDTVFADSTSLADVKVRWGTSVVDYLHQGEIGAAALQLIQYGQIDVRAKQRLAFAYLKARAVSDAARAGLRGQALKNAVERYLAAPPEDDRVAAVGAANLELLNYADTPEAINKLLESDYTRLVVPFPRFGYHYLAKQGKRLAGLKVFLGKVPPAQRADALADIITVGLFGLGGGGVVAEFLLRAFGGGDDEEARRRIGSSTLPVVQDDGSVKLQPLDREFVLANRVNLSAYLRMMGLGGVGEDDFWLRVRSYPMIAMAGAVIQAADDATRYGPAVGAETYLTAVKDLANDFFSVGAGVKVPAQIWARLQSSGQVAPVPNPFDPYAARVPALMYVTEQLVDSFIPGSRQIDELVTLVDPVRRRRTSSETLEYHPGMVEGLQIGHITGLADRLMRGGPSPLPPAGPIDRRTGTVEPSIVEPLEFYSRLVGFNIRAVPRELYEQALER